MSISAGGDKNHAFSVPAVADVAGARFVELDGSYAVADDDVAGVSDAPARVGETLSIVTYFSAPVEAAGPIAKGDKVGVSNDGTGRAVSGGNVGIAVTAAGAAGTRLEVALLRRPGDPGVGGAVASVAGKTGVVTLNVADVAGAAPLASPALTGAPTAPTPAGGDNTTKLATTAFVKAAIDALLSGAPGALDTLDELAAALGDDANFAASMTNLLANKQPLNVTPAVHNLNTAYALNANDREVRFTHAGGAPVNETAGMPAGALWWLTQEGAVGIEFVAATKFPNEVTRTTRPGQSLLVKHLGGNAYRVWGHTPPDEPIFVGTFDTLADLVAAYPHGSAALYALPNGSWANCKEYLAGSGLGGRIERPYAANQAAVKWSGRFIAWREAPTNLNVAYPLIATAPTATASSDGGTTTTVTHAGHGLPNLAAKNVYVTGGTGWAVGLVGYTYIDANSYKLAVAYNANVPTLRTATGAANPTTFRTITIPAGVQHANSAFSLYTEWSYTGSTNNKYAKVDYGAAMACLNASMTGASDVSLSDTRRVFHRGNLAAQICQANPSGTAYGRSTSLPTTGAENSGNAQGIKVYGDLPIGGTYMGVEVIELEMVL